MRQQRTQKAKSNEIQTANKFFIFNIFSQEHLRNLQTKSKENQRKHNDTTLKSNHKLVTDADLTLKFKTQTPSKMKWKQRRTFEQTIVCMFYITSIFTLRNTICHRNKLTAELKTTKYPLSVKCSHLMLQSTKCLIFHQCPCGVKKELNKNSD